MLAVCVGYFLSGPEGFYRCFAGNWSCHCIDRIGNHAVGNFTKASYRRYFDDGATFSDSDSNDNDRRDS